MPSNPTNDADKSREELLCELAALRLWVDNEKLYVQVEDSGKGFDPDLVVLQNNTYGLTGMRERVALVGGRWVLESTPGSGTSIVAELPLDGSSERRTQQRGIRGDMLDHKTLNA